MLFFLCFSNVQSSTEPVLAVEFHPSEKTSIVSCGKGQITFWTFEGGALTKKQGVYDVSGKIRLKIFKDFLSLSLSLSFFLSLSLLFSLPLSFSLSLFLSLSLSLSLSPTHTHTHTNTHTHSQRETRTCIQLPTLNLWSYIIWSIFLSFITFHSLIVYFRNMTSPNMFYASHFPPMVMYCLVIPMETFLFGAKVSVFDVSLICLNFGRFSFDNLYLTRPNCVLIDKASQHIWINI